MKLFRFPIFDSRFTVSRLRDLRVLDFRFPILVLILTGALGASCGGDDGNKAGGGTPSGGMSASERQEIWARYKVSVAKQKEVACAAWAACYPKAFEKAFKSSALSSVQDCASTNFNSTIWNYDTSRIDELSGGGGAAMECMLVDIERHEACIATLASKKSTELCDVVSSSGLSFTVGVAKTDVYSSGLCSLPTAPVCESTGYQLAWGRTIEN